MNDTLSKFIIFAAGVGIGSVVTWRLVKKYYNNIANKEIADVKDWYARKYSEKSESKKADAVGDAIRDGIKDGIKKPVTENDIRNLTAQLQNMGYVDYSNKEDEPVKKTEKIEEKEEADNVERPYVIEPRYFDEYDDYNTINLTLYADGVLVDDSSNEPVEDVDETVGLDNLDHIGEYEEDAVHIRNDKLRCDYEILCDTKKYSEICPHPAEDE